MASAVSALYNRSTVDRTPSSSLWAGMMSQVPPAEAGSLQLAREGRYDGRLDGRPRDIHGGIPVGGRSVPTRPQQKLRRALTARLLAVSALSAGPCGIARVQQFAAAVRRRCRVSE